MSAQMELIRRTVDYIEDHLDEKLDLAAVARAAHYSPYHLHRMFTGGAGLTLHTYLQRRRLTRAAGRLVEASCPIVEIAGAAGYENQQAFSAAFKAMYKRTPRQFREQAFFYPLQLPFVWEPQSCGDCRDLEQRVVPAQLEDIPQWMELMRLAVDGFPCWEERDCERQLRRYIGAGQALILKDGGHAAGILAFDPEAGSIECMAVHPQHRNGTMPQKLLDQLRTGYLPGRTIQVTTFRAGDKADTGHRAGWTRLGFQAAEELMEFGYPTQRMILSPEGRKGAAG